MFASVNNLVLIADEDHHLACILRISTAYGELNGSRFAPSKRTVIALWVGNHWNASFTTKDSAALVAWSISASISTVQESILLDTRSE